MKKILISTLVISSLALSAIAAEFTIKVTHVVSEDSPKGKSANYFAQKLEELTKGRIEVQVYPSASLYGDKQEMEAIKNNDAQFAIPSFSKFAKMSSSITLFDLPFLFDGGDHIHRVFESEVGRKVRDSIIKKGYIALNYWDNGFKHLSGKKPLLEPNDAMGQTFRIMPSNVLEKQFEAVNATPKRMSFSKVYQGLKDGKVNALENPLSNFYTKKFYDYQPHLTLSGHGYLGYLVIMSKDFWLSLPNELKPLVIEAMNEATEYNRKLAVELEKDYLSKLKKLENQGKLTVHELTPAQIQKWKDAMATIYPDFYDSIGYGLIKQVQMMGKN